MDNNAIMIKSFTPIIGITTIIGFILLVLSVIQQSRQEHTPSITEAIGFILSIYVFSIGVAWMLILFIDKGK